MAAVSKQRTQEQRLESRTKGEKKKEKKENPRIKMEKAEVVVGQKRPWGGVGWGLWGSDQLYKRVE